MGYQPQILLRDHNQPAGANPNFRLPSYQIHMDDLSEVTITGRHNGGFLRVDYQRVGVSLRAYSLLALALFLV
jgi:hypothetical protein